MLDFGAQRTTRLNKRTFEANYPITGKRFNSGVLWLTEYCWLVKEVQINYLSIFVCLVFPFLTIDDWRPPWSAPDDLVAWTSPHSVLILIEITTLIKCKIRFELAVPVTKRLRISEAGSTSLSGMGSSSLISSSWPRSVHARTDSRALSLLGYSWLRINC